MEVDDDFDDEVMQDVKRMTTDEIQARARLLDNEIKIMRSDIMRIQHELQTQKDKIKENNEKIKVRAGNFRRWGLRLCFYRQFD
jgi:26S proteasome regulatory subunit T5